MGQRERIVAYVRDRYGAEPEHLWVRHPNYVVFRHGASRKWFGLIMDLPCGRLDLDGDGLVDVLDVRCGAAMVGSLLTQDGFLPAYHMSKGTWISVILNDTVPDGEIFPLLELSYNSAAPKGTGG